MTKKALTSISEDRSRFELRMPSGLKAELEAKAEEAGVSLNSLICAMLYGLVKHSHVGVPMSDSGYLVSALDTQATKPYPLWFGEEGEPSEGDHGMVWFEAILGAGPQVSRRPMRVTDREIS